MRARTSRAVALAAGMVLAPFAAMGQEGGGGGVPASGSPGGTSSPGGGPSTDLMIVISGGISRGAYQAGQMYVLSSWLKEHAGDTAPGPFGQRSGITVVGSSAGSINALLTALDLSTSASVPAGGPWPAPEKSLYFTTWVPLGFDGTPTSLDAMGAPGDSGQQSLINGKMLQRIATGVVAGLPESAAPPQPPVRLVMTAARHQPVDTAQAGVSAEVTLSFGFELDGSEEAQVLAIRCPDGRPAGDHAGCQPGSEWAAPRPGAKVSLDRMARLAVASSTIPAAFPLFALSCEELKALTPDDGAPCNAASGERVVWLMDGGTLEGNPVRAGVPFAARQPGGDTGGPDHPHFLYLDPDLEGQPQRPPAHTDQMSQRYWQILGAAGGTTSLVSTLRNQSITLYLQDHPVASAAAGEEARGHFVYTRTPPYGNYLGGFLAFYERSFRVWDFYAGMEDALTFLGQLPGVDAAALRGRVSATSLFQEVASCRVSGLCPGVDHLSAAEAKTLAGIGDLVVPAPASPGEEAASPRDLDDAALWDNLRLLSALYAPQVEARDFGAPWTLDQLASALDQGTPGLPGVTFEAQDLGHWKTSMELRRRLGWQMVRTYKRDILDDSPLVAAVESPVLYALSGAWGRWRWGIAGPMSVGSRGGLVTGPGWSAWPARRWGLDADVLLSLDWPSIDRGAVGASTWAGAGAVQLSAGPRLGLGRGGVGAPVRVLGPHDTVRIGLRGVGELMVAGDGDGAVDLWAPPLASSGEAGTLVGVRGGVAVQVDLVDAAFLRGTLLLDRADDGTIALRASHIGFSAGLNLPQRLPFSKQERLPGSLFHGR